MIELRCPYCERKMRSADLMQAATLIIKRTCPGCRQRWLLKISPSRKKIKIRGLSAFVHSIDFMPLED